MWTSTERYDKSSICPIDLPYSIYRLQLARRSRLRFKPVALSLVLSEPLRSSSSPTSMESIQRGAISLWVETRAVRKGRLMSAVEPYRHSDWMGSWREDEYWILDREKLMGRGMGELFDKDTVDNEWIFRERRDGSVLWLLSSTMELEMTTIWESRLIVGGLMLISPILIRLLNCQFNDRIRCISFDDIRLATDYCSVYFVLCWYS